MSETIVPLNIAAPQTLDLLLSRRSGSAKAMKGPGPDSEQLRRILSAGVRVPDHGKLTPWRFILFEGEGRARMGAILAETIAGERDSSPERIEQERGRFQRAPIVIGIVSRAREQIAIPVWEQELSAGAVCMNMVIAAHAMGFLANWITEWCAYHPKVLERIGLKPTERIAGYIYIGHPVDPLEDRPRPPVDAITTRF
ncbi:MAG TPA: nitroreductase [Micropepsaceae bacterium]|nr:nitroreductase [Micropepsaceae bacterium]